MSNTGKLMGKCITRGEMKLLTGLHIGTSKDTMEIGGMDNAVIRDPLTREPYIPGSSLKGKLRMLLERALFATEGGGSIDSFFNKPMRSGGLLIRHHECSREECRVCRLFGASTGNGVDVNRPGRLLVGDCHLLQSSKEALEAIDTGLYLTEQKSENSLDRITSAANPRQQERVPRGTGFSFEIIYNADLVPEDNLFRQDVQGLFTGLRLLQDDALGGSVSRGYGRLELSDLQVRYRPLDYYTEGKAERVFAQDSEDLTLFAQRILDELR